MVQRDVSITATGFFCRFISHMNTRQQQNIIRMTAHAHTHPIRTDKITSISRNGERGMRAHTHTIRIKIGLMLFSIAYKMWNAANRLKQITVEIKNSKFGIVYEYSDVGVAFRDVLHSDEMEISEGNNKMANISESLTNKLHARQTELPANTKKKMWKNRIDRNGCCGFYAELRL